MRYRGPVGIVLAVAVLVAGSAFYVFLGGGVTVTDTTVRGSQTVGQITGDCEDVAMRDLFARVSIERDDYRRSVLFGGQKELTVTGTVDGETDRTTVSLDEIDRKTATLPRTEPGHAC